jgi:iron complex outermembrane receptor protein
MRSSPASPRHRAILRFPRRPLALAILLSVAGFAQAADADTSNAASAAADTADASVANSADRATTLDNVVVTGTRASGRTVENAVAPIDIVTGNAIELSNKANLLEQLGANLPSFFVPNVPTPNVGSMVRAGQLRGQNPGHTLVLINGKRRHSTAFLGAGGFSATAPVDLSTISSGAIQRIEVLRDGASAIYGSDAIAGVINIITDDAAEGGNASARYGQFFEGDGETTVLQASQGFPLGAAGHLRISGQRDEQKIVVRNSPVNPNLLYYFPLNSAGVEILPSGPLSSYPQLPAGATPNPREATRDNNAWKNRGKAPFTLSTFAADIGLPLNDAVEAYGFFSYAQRDSSAPQNFRTPNRNENVRALYPDGYTPVEEIDETDYSGLVGVRGDDWHGWDWDLSTVYGRDHIDVNVSNSVNVTYGLASPTRFFIGDHDYRAWTSNLDLSRQVDLFSIPTDLSIGAEHRREHYQLGAGDPAGYTHGGQRVLDGPNAGQLLGNSLAVSQALPAYRPADAQDVTRNSSSVYLGLALALNARWTLDLAGRYEHFSDFGNESTWRVSSRFDLTPRLALRGTVNTGFHAPALAALSYRSVGNANTSTNYVLSVNSPEARALGASALKPETSRNYSLGIVAEPFDGVHVAVDAYQIEVSDQITQIANFNTAARPLGPATATPSLSEQLTNGQILRGDGISYLVNASDTRTRGVEVTIDKVFGFDNGGRLALSYAANFNKIELTRIATAPPVLADYGITLLDTSAAINLRNSVPRERHILGANWKHGPWELNLRQNYWGALERSGTVSVPPTTGPWAGITQYAYDIGGLWTTDLDIAYAFSDALKVSLAGNNLFEARPTQTPGPLLAAQAIYDWQNNGAIGPEGGFWSLKLDYRW